MRAQRTDRERDWRGFAYPFVYGQADPALVDHAAWRDCASGRSPPPDGRATGKSGHGPLEALWKHEAEKRCAIPTDADTLEQAEGSEFDELINMTALRSMQQAYYNPENFVAARRSATIGEMHLSRSSLLHPRHSRRYGDPALLDDGSGSPRVFDYAEVRLQDFVGRDGSRTAFGGWNTPALPGQMAKSSRDLPASRPSTIQAVGLGSLADGADVLAVRGTVRHRAAAAPRHILLDAPDLALEGVAAPAAPGGTD
ncbi:hypothetical protein VB636_21775, partial [Paracoccus sp. APAP_BH8]